MTVAINKKEETSPNNVYISAHIIKIELQEILVEIGYNHVGSELLQK